MRTHRESHHLTDATRERRLIAASTVFTVGVLIHNLDHVRRGGSAVSADVFWIGTLAIFDEVAVVVLAFLRHRLAPAMALLSGVTLAAGYILVHFTPQRTWLSDPLIGSDASPVSILAATIETVAAVVLAAVGYLLVTSPRHGHARRTPVDLSPAGLRHPVVFAMVGGNAFILVASLATR